jgi:hypothetical protein
VALNLVLLAHPLTGLLLAMPHDWVVFAELPGRLDEGTLYGRGPLYIWVWTPAAAWIMATVFVPLGYPLWLGLHLASVAALRQWRLIALTVVSIPFWVDSIMGHMMVFVLVAGAMALRGSRIGSIAYVVLTVLAPRPLQVPLLIWLLWNRPELRIPFVVASLTVVVHAVASGYAVEWLTMATSFSASTNAGNLGPSALFGTGWMVVGVPLSAWLTLRGRVGLAGLALSPYVLMQYWLVFLWEIAPRRKQADGARERAMSGGRQ